MGRKLADGFIGVYPVSKTLRFELKPVGKTLDFIEKDGVINEDVDRSENYAKVKAFIDEYHKALIQKVLEKTNLEKLEEYEQLYNRSKRNASEEKKFEACQENLRKQLSKALKASPEYKTIDKKELIRDDLQRFFAQDDEKLSQIRSFSEFTTYFSGFHQNRQNMYSDEPKSTSIAYRVVHQNLPKYVDNIK
ncbi:MAG: hypothetical protein Q4D81_11025, partial [Eubacteriales bacterium]|nr:hypothetical protein [Eubacteriales bacterium]